MNRAFLVIPCSVAVALAVNVGNVVSGQQPERRGPGLRSIPIVQLQKGQTPKPRFRFAFLNETGRRFHYIGPNSPASLDLVLYKGATFVHRLETSCRFVSKRHVRSIKADEFLEADFQLDRYPKLKPGRHEVIAYYSVAKTHWAVKEFGLTPLQFARTLMIFDVGSPSGAGSKNSSKRLVAPEGKARSYYRNLLQIPRTLSPAGLRPIPIATVELTSASKARYRFGFQNITGKPLRYMQGRGGPRTCDGVRIAPLSNGKPLRSHGPKPEPVTYAKGRVQTLKNEECFQSELNLARFRDWNPGRYEVQAEYDVAASDHATKEYGLTPIRFKQTVMYLDVIEPLPKKLSKRKRYRIKRVYSRNKMGAVDLFYFIGVDVGLGPTRDNGATLFFVVRRSEFGKEKLKDTPDHIFRPIQINPGATIETMLYNPFPEEADPVILLHVLVSEPRKPQKYFVLDLSDFHTTLTKSRTLNANVSYKLHKKPLGPVELVPGTRR